MPNRGPAPPWRPRQPRFRPGGRPAEESRNDAAEAPSAVLFRDVRIFDGVDPELTRGHVLTEGDRIARVSTDPITPPAGARIVEGAGRILSPGFIDLHAHLTISMPRDQLNVHPWVAGALAGDAARTYLHNGFTTVPVRQSYADGRAVSDEDKP